MAVTLGLLLGGLGLALARALLLWFNSCIAGFCEGLTLEVS